MKRGLAEFVDVLFVSFASLAYGVERPVRIAKAGLFVPPLKEPILAALELVGDERGNEVQWHELFTVVWSLPLL